MVNAAGVPYLAGHTHGNFPLLNAFQPSMEVGSGDAFLVKLGMVGTTTVINSSAPNPSNEGQAVTVIFSLAANEPGSASPRNRYGQRWHVNCVATFPVMSCNLTLISPGVKNLTATYSGDANFNPSTSTGGGSDGQQPGSYNYQHQPHLGLSGRSGFTMTVNGTNFFDGTMVRWNGSDRVTTFVNSTQLTAFIPATDLKTVGTGSITVAHPGPTGDVSNAMILRVSPRLFLPLIAK